MADTTKLQKLLKMCDVSLDFLDCYIVIHFLINYTQNHLELLPFLLYKYNKKFNALNFRGLKNEIIFVFFYISLK